MIRRGDKEVTALYRGETPIVAVYRGDRLVWEKDAAMIEFSGTATGTSFRSRINVKYVTIPVNSDGTFSYKMKGVLTNAGYMFSTSSVVTLDLSKVDFSNVSSMSSMFESCPQLESLNVGELDATGKSVDMMFLMCSALTHIRCTTAFRDWCWANQDKIYLPSPMRSGGTGTWELID